MKKNLALGICILLMLGCAEKKDAGIVAQDKPETQPVNTCPLSRVSVTPEKTFGGECVLGGGCRVELTAQAFDQSGSPVNADLYWSMRFPEAGDDKRSGGHHLESVDANHAVFVGSGVAPGVFTVLVEDRSCNLYDDKYTQYVGGEAWIKVENPPDADIICGPMRVTYGDRLDKMGDTVLASSKVTLFAELSTNVKLDRFKHRIRFTIKDKELDYTRPLYLDAQVNILEGKKYGYMAFLPIYLAPGEYTVRYDFLVDGEEYCGSRTERFKAR